MSDDKPSRRSSPVSYWKNADVGIDSDAWLTHYRRRLRSHDNPAEANAFYRRIFEDSPAPMLIATTDFVIADANAAAQQLFSRGLAELRDMPFHRLVAKSDREAFVGIRQDIEDQKAHVTRPLRLKMADETDAEVSLIALSFRDESNAPEFVMLMLVPRGTRISEDML